MTIQTQRVLFLMACHLYIFFIYRCELFRRKWEKHQQKRIRYRAGPRSQHGLQARNVRIRQEPFRVSFCQPTAGRIFAHLGKTKRRFLAKFRLFSAHFPPIFPPMVPHPTCMFTEFAYFRLFTSIFRLKWYPILVMNSSMEPICCFSAHMFTDSAYFPLIFHSFLVYFPPNLLPIFGRSCLAGIFKLP